MIWKSKFVISIVFVCKFTAIISIPENLFEKSQNVTLLHKELLEVNLSITAYIEESKKRLEALRLGLAREAKSSQKVVEILSEKCKCFIQCYSDKNAYLLAANWKTCSFQVHFTIVLGLGAITSFHLATATIVGPLWTPQL